MLVCIEQYWHAFTLLSQYSQRKKNRDVRNLDMIIEKSILLLKIVQYATYCEEQ